MIKTTLEQLDHYACVHPRFEAAFKALREKAAEPFVKGKIPVCGDEIYINALEYDTRSVVDVKFEAHKVYIDVMLAISGMESISCRSGQIPEEMISDYNEENDCYLSGMEIPHSVFFMKPGDVCIFFPGELHAPGVFAEGERDHVTKFVMKVLA